MTKAKEFTQAEWEMMKNMRKSGKTLREIAAEFNCNHVSVSRYLNGTRKPPIKKAPPKKPSTIREILEAERAKDAAERAKEEAERAEREKDWCKFECCNDRKNCTDIQHPQQCLVWQLYNDPEKKSIRKQVLVDRRKVKKNGNL